MGKGYDEIMDTLMQQYRQSSELVNQSCDDRVAMYMFSWKEHGLKCKFGEFNHSIGANTGVNVVVEFSDKSGSHYSSGSGLLYNKQEYDSIKYIITRYFPNNEKHPESDPIYFCEKCGHIATINSRNEIFCRNRRIRC